ncbi:hypothetical protein P152DRAFT_5618 [Eremomyces bilateralis CBS 781.70]|uniref:RSC complex subunit Rsc7 n=1 Tax=Eremomyces bilateralis CBS 781.70 TaxID=1392243 RepID=A0A6G1GGF8_9PEZI|nr:uncharacterized protein P152DRAFT_5618 [Eremomyces bilateralis CBS 781.70]KAF1816991.1 hypothetical protein P152DRAFT_5618 [Eremomyces bilateralis CBS 781.70]
MSHPGPINGGLGHGSIDGSGTINPAALNAIVPGVPQSAVYGMAQQSTPRGMKRSRTPDVGDDHAVGAEADDSKPRKRGRPPKAKLSDASSTAVHGQTPIHHPIHTPRTATQQLPQTSPSHASPPPKATPTKTTVVKALPTVRDHTTDQLNEEGDEYIPREFDEAGEKKIAPNGAPLDGREYHCRTFYVPNRGDKLFMLATECARVLGYRDSYLLFNKNRSLFKIIASQAEKDDLIQQEVLPYSYRSRQIAIVTARSMFRQFGSRLIKNGRRVRDDYWESKARKQGFTEEDAAGEKRPGGAKAREAAAAEASGVAHLTALPHGEIIYSNGPNPFEQQPGMGGLAASLAPLPMINPLADLPRGDYGIQRPRHEITGTPYQDRTQPSTATEILNQAAQTAEYNKVINQQRTNRGQYLEDIWKRPHDPPQQPRPATPAEQTAVSRTSHALPSPQMVVAGTMPGGSSQTPNAHHRGQQPPMMAPSPYTQPTQHHPSMVAPSPVQGIPQPSLRPDQHPHPLQQQHRSPSVGSSSGANVSSAPSHVQQPQSSYTGYPPHANQIWGQQPPQPVPSPLQHQAYGYSQNVQQQSPHLQQQSPMQPPQLPPQHQTPNMHAAGAPSPMGYPSMHQHQGGMGGPAQGYANPSPVRNPQMNFHPGQPQQQFMHPGSPAQGGAQAGQGMHGWTGQTGPAGQSWQGF